MSGWFAEARLGLFVHFGLYSGAARHEWVQTYERLTDAEYRVYFDHFEPDRFDARSIARAARLAGAGYVVLTTKHHEGFALWDTAQSDFSAPRACGRDLVREFVDAVRAEGLRVGLYHSLIDWHHPDFTVDWVHPRRDDEAAHALNQGRDMARYRSFLHGQVRELLTGYGRIDYLFFDYTYPEAKDGWAGKSADDWDSAGLLALCRELQPGVLVNDRLGIPGDFVTPEQYQPTSPLTVDGAPQAWEACQTMNGSWGYHRDNVDHKPAGLLVQMLVDSVSMGGNMLLNVGPDGRGAIAPHDAAALAEIGAWMELHRGAVVGLINVGPRANGSIPGLQLAAMRELGAWLRVNGEAVYGTRPWVRAGDPGAPALASPVAYTTTGGAVHAHALDPAVGAVRLPEELRGRACRWIGAGDATADGAEVPIPEALRGAAAAVLTVR